VGDIDSYPNNNFQVAIYSDADGTGSGPDSLLGASLTSTLMANTWNCLPISTVVLDANTPYWLAYTSDGTGPSFNNMYYTSNLRSAALTQTFTFGSYADPWPGSTTFLDVNYGMYAPYDSCGTTTTSTSTTGGCFTPSPMGPSSITGFSQDSCDSQFLLAVRQVSSGITDTISSITTYFGPVESSPNNLFRVAIYNDDGSGMYPGTLLVQSVGDTTIIPNSMNIVAIPTTLIISSTVYWITTWNSGSSCTNTNSMWFQSQQTADDITIEYPFFSLGTPSYGSFPDPFPITNTSVLLDTYFIRGDYDPICPTTTSTSTTGDFKRSFNMRTP
jgi:hypothetical protein